MKIKTGDLVKHRTNDFFYMVVTFAEDDFDQIDCTWLDQEGHVQHERFFDFELTRVNK